MTEESVAVDNTGAASTPKPTTSTTTTTTATIPDAKASRKAQLRKANQEAWEGLIPDATFMSLDSSLKRNTAFIKRIRTNLTSPDSTDFFLKEISALNLEKYSSEIVGAAIEVIAKCKVSSEIQAAVEVLSALHQRLGPIFTEPFINQLTQMLQPPSKATLAGYTPEQREKEESTRISKQRNLLRVYTELDVANFIKGDGDGTFVILKNLFADKDLLVVSIPLATAFTKHAAYAFLPTKTSQDPTPSEMASPDKSLDIGMRPQTREKFKKFFVAYFDALGRRAVKDHTHLLETDRRNHEAYIRSGEIFEDRAQNYEKMSKNWEKLWAGVQTLSEQLSLSLPELPPLAIQTITATVGPTSSAVADSELPPTDSRWLDEEERRFYEDILDLKNEVPLAYISEKPQKQEQQAESAPPISTDVSSSTKDKSKEKENNTATGTMESSSGPATTEPTNTTNSSSLADAEDDSAMAAAPAAQLSAILARLPDIRSRDLTDKLAVEFASLNSKGARKRLVKAISAPPKGHEDILPYYARLVAILGKYLKDIPAGLLSILEEEFKYLQRKKTVKEVHDTRIRNARYLSELTKFGLVPDHYILHCVKVCADDFAHFNIDTLCELLEGCGRYLLRSESTREKMASFLDVVKRKTSHQHFDQRRLAMVENAYYQCDPPDRPIIEPKVRTPQELFIKHLLSNVLVRSTLERKTNISKVLKILRKMQWDDPEVVRHIHSAFCKIWKVKFSNIPLFATLLHDLGKYHPDFTVNVVDEVLENIRVGMERNNFKQNQQRLASIKFLGELYVCRVVEARVIFDTLWSLVTFAHREGRPRPDVVCPLDSPDDFFRVRLICTLLDTVGRALDRHSFRSKLDQFLMFFQVYLHCKSKMPLDTEFQVSDTFESLRPKMKLPKSFEEAVTIFEEMVASVAAKNSDVNNAAPGNAPEDELNGPDDEARLEGDESLTETEADTDDDEGEGGEFDEDVASPKNDTEHLPEEEEEEDYEVAQDEEEEDDEAEDDDDDDEDDDYDKDNVDEEDEEQDTSIIRRKRNQISQEEEDAFNRELAKMMADPSDKRPPVGGRQNLLDVNLPMLKRATNDSSSTSATTVTKENEDENENENASNKDDERMTFTLLTKKGPKQQTKQVQVPTNASLAMHTRSKQLQDKVEQQQLKRLVLQFEQKQEDESRQAMQDSMARRGIRVKFNSGGGAGGGESG